MSPTAPLARLWRDLPLCYLWLTSFSLLNLEMNVLGSERAAALFGFAPLFILVSLAWLGRAAPWGRAAYLSVSAIVLVVLLAGLTGKAPPPLTLLRIFEVSALLLFGVFVLHCVLTAGTGILLLIFGVGLIYGLFLENVGVAAGVFVEAGYRIYVPGLPAPLCTALGWCNVWYALWWLTPRLTGEGAPPLVQARLALGLALILDLQLDPAATGAGFWTWNQLLPPAIRGVPLLNFNAWVAAVWPFSRQVFLAQRGPGNAAWRVLLRLPRIVVEAFLLLTLLTLVTESGSGWPSVSLFLGLLGSPGR